MIHFEYIFIPKQDVIETLQGNVDIEQFRGKLWLAVLTTPYGPAKPYVKILKIQTHGKISVIIQKIGTVLFYYRVMVRKDADGIANSLDLSVRKRWIITVMQCFEFYIATLCCPYCIWCQLSI